MDPGYLVIAVVLVAIIAVTRLYLRGSAQARRRRAAELHRFDMDGADGRRIQRIRRRNGRGFD